MPKLEIRLSDETAINVCVAGKERYGGVWGSGAIILKLADNAKTSAIRRPHKPSYLTLEM